MACKWGKVVQITEEKEAIQFLFVQLAQVDKIIPAIHYVTFGERCVVGDLVKVNLSALYLNLGTGGYGFVQSKAFADEQSVAKESTIFPGHIMKLRYTPWQTPVLACEAPESKAHDLFNQPFDLGGKYIFLGELHSMLPVLVSLIKNWDIQRKIAYIMDDQAALYSSFSHHLRYLQEKMGLIVITYGQGLGGDLECVNIYTALEAAFKIVQADDIIITQGPGVVGTSTQRGFSGMHLVHWLHAVHTCGGRALVIPRIQFSDKRSRHLGLSEHTLFPLANHALAPASLAYPCSENRYNKEDIWLSKQLEQLQAKHELHPISIIQFKQELEWALGWYGRPLQTMGKSFKEEPYFYYALGASFQLYKENSIPL